MNALPHTHTNDPPENPRPGVELYDHVRVRDGREGQVIGFYRREHDSVVVRFPTGDSDEFFTPEVDPV